MIPVFPGGYYVVREAIRRREADPLPPMSKNDEFWLGVVLCSASVITLGLLVVLAVVLVRW